MLADAKTSDATKPDSESAREISALLSLVTVLHQPPQHDSPVNLVSDGSHPILSLLSNGDSGLQLLTTDTHAHTRAAAAIRRLPVTYRVEIERKVDDALLSRLKRGVTDYGDFMAAADAKAACTPSGNSCLELTLHRDRGVTVRRLLAAFGIRTRSITRLSIGPIQLGNTAPGHKRPLTEQELLSLSQPC
ncbi:MAG: hypothetical protein RI897_1621 [Verrucomicrobiota bacterium]